MSAFNLGKVMDAIASKVPAAASKRVYAWPVENITIPCAVVGYPTELEFDQTYGRGSDKAVIPLWFMVGKFGDRTSRDSLSAIITGATGIKDAMDGDLALSGGGTAALRVTDCRIEEIVVASISYAAARFELEVIS